jgi:hypothetical protein
LFKLIFDRHCHLLQYKSHVCCFPTHRWVVDFALSLNLFAGHYQIEEELLAARAYDKASMWLYGARAITNFGLEACQLDPTEVSTAPALHLLL